MCMIKYARNNVKYKIRFDSLPIKISIISDMDSLNNRQEIEILRGDSGVARGKTC